MSGVYKGSVMGGIGQGIQQGVSGVLNLYQMHQRQQLQQQALDIKKQNSDIYQKMMQYNMASRFEKDFDPAKWSTPQVRQPAAGGIGSPQASRLGVDSQSLQQPDLPDAQGDPRYLQPGASALLME